MDFSESGSNSTSARTRWWTALHIKFRDERAGVSNPYFEILDANRDVVYNSSRRCEEKNCVLDLTNGPDARPRDAGNDRLSDTSVDDPYDYTGLFYGGRRSSCANLPDGGVSQCKAECDCMFDSGCTKGSGGVCGYDCTGACYCHCPGGGGWANAGTLEVCHAYCDLAYVHAGDKTAATAAAAAAALAAAAWRLDRAGKRRLIGIWSSRITANGGTKS